jgi:hypothetical protein
MDLVLEIIEVLSIPKHSIYAAYIDGRCYDFHHDLEKLKQSLVDQKKYLLKAMTITIDEQIERQKEIYKNAVYHYKKKVEAGVMTEVEATHKIQTVDATICVLMLLKENESELSRPRVIQTQLSF